MTLHYKVLPPPTSIQITQYTLHILIHADVHCAMPRKVYKRSSMKEDQSALLVYFLISLCLQHTHHTPLRVCIQNQSSFHIMYTIFSSCIFFVCISYDKIRAMCIVLKYIISKNELGYLFLFFSSLSIHYVHSVGRGGEGGRGGEQIAC